MLRILHGALLTLLCAAGGHAEAPVETIGGHDTVWWSAQARAHEREIEGLEQDVTACEEREAPRAYRNVPGQVYRGRDGLRYRELKRCDEQRAALKAAREAQEEFEDLARRLEVPPGWLR
jgi:hypothetical protein